MAIFSEIVIILSLSTFVVSKSWCSLTCGEEKKPNIVCLMKEKCNVHKPCKLEELDKNDIVDTHNELRDKFASGSEKVMEGLEVANMNALQWDKNLAFAAQCNLANCTIMGHDTCHKTPQFSKHVGQNVWTFGIDTMGGDCIGEALNAIRQWYEEINIVSDEEIKGNAISYQAVTHNTEHFTQIVWAETTHVGCALTRNENDGITLCRMVCNYGPGGNVVGGSMFKQGEPCSQCPIGVFCSSVFESLCGDHKRSAADRPPNADRKVSFVLLLYITFVFII